MDTQIARTAALHELRTQIEQCRQGHHRRAPLPEQLWRQAMSWARKLGPYQASRALGVSYDSLRRRMENRPPNGPVSTSFVEFQGAQLLDLDAGGVVEVVDEAGARLTIRVSARALDAAAVVAAFRGTH